MKNHPNRADSTSLPRTILSALKKNTASVIGRAFHALIVVAVMGTLLTFNSCEKPAPSPGPGPNPTEIAVQGIYINPFSPASGSGTLNAGKTTFSDGDRIGIIAVEGGTLRHDNIPYIYDAAQGWQPETENVVMFYDNATYTAYYPYSESMDGKATPGALVAAFSPAVNQSAAADFLRSDLLIWSGSPTVTGTDASLNLAFSHSLSLIVVEAAKDPTHVSTMSNVSVRVTTAGTQYTAYGAGSGRWYVMGEPDGLAVARVSYTYQSQAISWDNIDNPARTSAGTYVVVAYEGSIPPPPDGYYAPAHGKAGNELRQALRDILDGHTELTYASLWVHFRTTDVRPDGKVWDMYSDVPGGTPAYLFTFGTDQCGSSGYQGEGDCYNREHSFPKSWFNEATPMVTDLFHLYPTDGKVNQQRDNYPFGEVGTATWTSTNGSKRGYSSYSGYSGMVFEPIDEYKGDFARTYFYMLTRYSNEVSRWSSPMLSGSNFSSWARTMLLEWHENDPVSEKEINRNEAVYAVQHNRNPYIDHPELTDHIWGDKQNVPFQLQ